uniref:Uncharacterized protein n=1 Tax=Rhizophora mucronata TaxID=61149 RepID=A0A2P2NAS9_RHIMU
MQQGFSLITIIHNELKFCSTSLHIRFSLTTLKNWNPQNLKLSKSEHKHASKMKLKAMNFR